MSLKANLVLFAGLSGLLVPLGAQVSNNPTLPSVPRADGTGPDIPSMSQAVGDAAPPAQSGPKPGAKKNDQNRSAADPLRSDKPSANATAPSPAVSTGRLAPPNTPAPQLPGGTRTTEGEPTVSSAGPAGPAPVVLDTSSVAQQIRELAFDKRSAFLDGLDARLADTEQVLTQLRQVSRGLTGEARTAYAAADDIARDKEKAFKRSLKEAHKATVDNWAKIRGQLAADCEAYEVALARMETSSAVGR